MTVMPLPEGNDIEAGLKRDRSIILTALCALFVVAWAYIMAGAGTGLSPFQLTINFATLSETALKPSFWTAATTGNYAVLWFLLSIALVLPASTPNILLHAAENRKKRDPVNAGVFAALVILGYLLVWAVYAVAMTGILWGLEQFGHLNQAYAINNPLVVGCVFVCAGLYQFVGLKTTAMKHLRRPEQYIFNEWRDGVGGAFAMGCNLGLYLLASTWLLFGLLFAGGILNILWIGGLAVLIMIEKLSANARVISIMAGCALTCWGFFVVFSSLQP